MILDALAQVGPVVISILAFVLSLSNLYLQRRDRATRLGIRVRYEYRASDEKTVTDDEPRPQLHEKSQERLYMLLGDFVREYGIEYPAGRTLARFALSNRGTKPVYLDDVRLELIEGKWSTERRIVDLKDDRIVARNLAGDTANILRTSGEEGSPVEILPGDSVGYKFELSRLANLLLREGYSGDVRLALRAKDRLGNTYRCPFHIHTDLWSYS